VDLRSLSAWFLGTILATTPFVACSSSSSNPGDPDKPDAGCASVAGDWTIDLCGLKADCIIIQAGCTVSVGCQALFVTGAANGTVSGNNVVFATDGGSCTGEFLSTVASGNCQGYDAGDGGSCQFSAIKK
jgi:hypothetical protein